MGVRRLGSRYIDPPTHAGSGEAVRFSKAGTNDSDIDWVSEFAPRKQQRFLSYIVGWLAALGWQALIATTAYSASVLILSMASIMNPAYVTQNWHQSLLMIGIGLIGTLMNIYGAKWLPMLETVVLIFTIFGFFCIIIPLWVIAPKASPSQVFGSFENFGGWSTIGTACFVGSITATGSFAGSDAAAHLAEETTNASKTVPRMIMFTVALNGVMGLVFIITYVSFHPGRRLNVTELTKLLVLLYPRRGGCHQLRVTIPVHRCA